MLDIKFIRDNQDLVKKAIVDKQINFDLNHLISLDDQRRKLIVETEAIRSRRNEIAEKLKNGKDQELVLESKKLKANLGKLELELEEVEEQWKLAMESVPNVPVEDVPVGKDETENQVVKKAGEPKKYNFEIKDHVALGQDLDFLDMERASKVSGARFGYWKGAAALMEAALIQYVFKTLTDQKIVSEIAASIDTKVPTNTFVPIIPPVIIKPDIYTRTARISPQDKDDKYHLDQDDLYLIGSAEHTLVAMHMDETLSEEQLPKRYIGFSTSFRREAGSYGKDTKGMLRVHQFDKLEMESFSAAELSLLEHKFFIAVQEYLMQALELPYQLVINCTGDMGKPNARQVDVETWIPSQKKYRETHSADYMADFQARRLNIKYKKKDGTTEFVHTNDATAIAMSRTLIAIFENYQQADGSVLVPKILQEYLGKEVIKKE